MLEIPGVTGKFGHGVRNEAEQRLIEFYQGNLVDAVSKTYVPGEGNGNPLQYCCLGNPVDGGAW